MAWDFALVDSDQIRNYTVWLYNTYTRKPGDRFGWRWGRFEDETMGTHVILNELLFKIPFIPSVPNDENRAIDGMSLRDAYIDSRYSWTTGHPRYDDEQWQAFLRSSCSMLEMMIALAIRISFDTEGFGEDTSVSYWFWKMIDNIGCDVTDYQMVTDQRVKAKCETRILEVVDRRYSANGVGGLFPLSNPNGDQRKVELWYQMSAYLIEKQYVKI